MATKGVIMYAKTNVNCLQCGALLKAGERTPHQTLCSTGRNSKILSRCQVLWYGKRKQERIKALNFIICDTCHKKIKPEDPRQVRCMSGIKGVLSNCQIKARNKICKERAEAQKVIDEDKKKQCLKCGKYFVSTGMYNRICDSCAAVNSRVARKMHRMAVY